MTHTKRIRQLFEELLGPRASRLAGERSAVETIERLAEVLTQRFDPETAYEIAFHLSDWNSDAAFITAMHLFPERFTEDEIADGVDAFLIHAPNHIAAAAQLARHPVRDIFEVKVRFHVEADDWHAGGSIITAEEKLRMIQETLENSGPIIVQHWHYRGSAAPDRRVFSEYDEFLNWLRQETVAGDAVDVWSWEAVCRPENQLVEGKCPDEQGRVPRRGAY